MQAESIRNEASGAFNSYGATDYYSLTPQHPGPQATEAELGKLA
jgi:hypothetical protein